MKNSPFLKAIALLFIFSSACVANAEVYYKEIRKSVKVNSTVRLDMDIDYADVNITTWDQGTIEIIVKQNVDSKSESRANEIFENMRVNVIEGTDLVGLEVSMGNYSCSGKTESYSIHSIIIGHDSCNLFPYRAKKSSRSIRYSYSNS